MGHLRLCEVRRAGGVAGGRPVPLAVGEAPHCTHHRVAQVVNSLAPVKGTFKLPAIDCV